METFILWGIIVFLLIQVAFLFLVAIGPMISLSDGKDSFIPIPPRPRKKEDETEKGEN